MQQSLYSTNRQQVLLFGATIFVSITAAVIVSTVIIMTLMRGEIANALASTIKNSPPTAQSATSCTVPAKDADSTDEVEPADTSTESLTTSAADPLTSSVHFAKYVPTSVNNSFNATNTSSTTTTNNVTNTEIHKKTTLINDSFNDNSKNSHNVTKDSYNPIIVKDNVVNSNNDIGNTTIKKTEINSNNSFEQHVLSDNTIITAPLPVVVFPTT